jgi:hypothetical protein
MEGKNDMNRPFIAIRSDEECSVYDATMGEYLCNPLTEDLLDVRVSTGGFYSDDELGVISSVPKEEATFTVRAGTAVRFEMSTWDEFTEMSVHWKVRYRTEGSEFKTLSFASDKRVADAEMMSNVPILGGPGRVLT